MCEQAYRISEEVHKQRSKWMQNTQGSHHAHMKVQLKSDLYLNLHHTLTLTSTLTLLTRVHPSSLSNLAVQSQQVELSLVQPHPSSGPAPPQLTHTTGSASSQNMATLPETDAEWRHKQKVEKVSGLAQQIVVHETWLITFFTKCHFLS